MYIGRLATQVSKRNLKVVRSGGQIIQYSFKLKDRSITVPRAESFQDCLPQVSGDGKMAEAIQQLVLDALDSQGKIKDTRTLVLPGQSDAAATQDAQIAILGALNSLLSREVLVLNLMYGGLWLYSHVLVDGHDRLSRNTVACVDPRRRTDRSRGFSRSSSLECFAGERRRDALDRATVAAGRRQGICVCGTRQGV